VGTVIAPLPSLTTVVPVPSELALVFELLVRKVTVALLSVLTKNVAVPVGELSTQPDMAMA
jgi:hypothetical protein